MISQQEFTNAGRSMLGRAQNSETLHITKIVVGSGAATQPSELWPLTELIHWELDVDISARRDYGDGQLLIEGSFKSDEAAGAFSLRELGVMAHIGNEVDRLYSVANCFDDPPDYVDPASPSIFSFKIKMVVDRIPDNQLTIQIGPTDNVMGENIGADTIGPGPYKEAAGNVLYFKRFIEGDGIRLTQDVDEETITIATRKLDVNVDLYVPPSHPQCPDPSVGFESIQLAHDYLLQFTIPTNRTATIHVYSGTFDVDAPGIRFTHPNSRQINLKGEARIDKAATAIYYVDSGHKDVACDNSGLAIGQWVYLAHCAGGWAGGSKVTDIHPPNVEVSTYNRSGQTPYSVNDSGANPNRRLSRLPTLVKFNGTPAVAEYLFYAPYGIGLIENMCFDGGWYCVVVEGGGAFKNVMATNSRRGFSFGSGDFAFGEDVVVTDCDFGIVGLGTLQGYDQTYVNGCGTGVTPSATGFALGSIQAGMPDAVVFINNCTYGISGQGSRMIGGTIYFFKNDYGIAAGEMSSFNFGAAYPSYPFGNGVDLYATQMSFIQYDRWQGTLPTCSPTAESVGNYNSFIHVKNSS